MKIDDKGKNVMGVRLTRGEMVMVNIFNMTEYRINSDQTLVLLERDHLDT